MEQHLLKECSVTKARAEKERKQAEADKLAKAKAASKNAVRALITKNSTWVEMDVRGVKLSTSLETLNK